MRKLFVLLAAVAFVFAFTVPAMAEVSLYGSARLDTGYVDDETISGGVSTSDKDILWDLEGGSRFGANFTNETVSGHIEYGYSNQVATKVTGGSHYVARVRLLYGTWNFGAGTLTVGRTYSPTFAPISGQAGQGGMTAGYGDWIGACRIPQLKLGIGGLQVALETPDTSLIGLGGAADADASIPRITAAYSLSFGPAAIKVYGGYQSYEEVVAGPPEVSYDVDSTIFGGTVNVGFGPGYVKAGYYMSTNPNQQGWAAGPIAFDPVLSGTEVKNVDWDGYLACAGYKATETISLEVGYGSSKAELEGTLVNEDECAIYYASAAISLAKGVTIYPEYVVTDEKDHIINGVASEQGKDTYMGIYWKIDF